VLVELGVVEQRTKAVYEVLDGASVTEVALRYGVCRRTVHAWLRKYANTGFSALVDKSSKPETCPHQMPPVLEARVVEMRRAHPPPGALGRSATSSARRGSTHFLESPPSTARLEILPGLTHGDIFQSPLLATVVSDVMA
jgi:transposase-like protein